MLFRSPYHGKYIVCHAVLLHLFIFISRFHFAVPFLGILVAEIFLFLVTHFYILRYRENIADWIGLPEILTNPVFIALILTALAAGSYFFERWLDRLRPTAPAPITFTSDRKPVTLPLEEILYVESNDATTTVVATGDRRFKNITPISQWEAILRPHFLRIHRSYLVNKEAITRVDGDLLYVHVSNAGMHLRFPPER